MLKWLTYILFFSGVLFLSCTKEKSKEDAGQQIEFDIFLVIGQSNVFNGYKVDYTLDKTDSRIKQLGRYGTKNYQIIEAKDPLDHFTKVDDRNGFVLTFSLLYLQHYWEGNRKVLLIPAAENGSSFRYKRWNKGDTLYNDVVARTRYVLDKFPGSKVKGFLWHQGESDVYWGRDYAGLLDRMISNMRYDIAGSAGDSIPFIVGGFVPYWVDKYPAAKITDSVISETAGRLPFIGYASARVPFIIQKPVNYIDEIHFDAAGQRELGKRYFEAYKRFQN